MSNQSQNKTEKKVEDLREDLHTTRTYLNEITRLSSFQIMFSEGEQQSILHLREAIQSKAEFVHRIRTK